MMRGVSSLLASALIVATTLSCEPPQVSPVGLGDLHREAFHGHPPTCNGEAFVKWMPVPTELGSRLDCLGWYEWHDERALQLDVVRYGTIAKVWPIRHFEVPQTLIEHRIITKGAVIDVTRTLKGAAPLGRHTFTAGTSIHSQPIERHSGWKRRLEQERAGGRSHMLYGHEPGLLFIPSDQVVDGLFLGCLGGHFARPDRYRPKLLDDYEILTRLLRWRSLDGLKNEPVGAPLLEALVEAGGSTVGYFVAEFYDWRVSMDLLRRSMDRSPEISPFEVGLVEGMVRMQFLRRLRQYPAPTWETVDDLAVGALLLNWAVLRLPDLPERKRTWPPSDSMTDRQRRVAAWIVSWMPSMVPSLSRDDLIWPQAEVDSFAGTLRSHRGAFFGGYRADAGSFDRVLNGQPPRLGVHIPAWFTDIGICGGTNGLISSKPLRPWAIEAYGEHIPRH